MNFSLILWKLMPLYLEILKTRMYRFLRAVFSSQNHSHNELDKKIVNEICSQSSDGLVALARWTDAGDYNVILPYSGKVLIPRETFEKLYSPIEPLINASMLGIKNAAWKNVYQKYIAI